MAFQIKMSLILFSVERRPKQPDDGVIDDCNNWWLIGCDDWLMNGCNKRSLLRSERLDQHRSGRRSAFTKTHTPPKV